MQGKRDMTLLANRKSKFITFFEADKTEPTVLKISTRNNPDELQKEAIELAQVVERAYKIKNDKIKALQ